GFYSLLDRRVAPQVQALAATAARQQAAEAISAAVERVLAEERVTYGRLVGYADENGVRSMQTNAMELNLLRGKINSAVEKAVSQRRGRLRLPLGALLGSSLFAGAGPNITVPLSMAGSALSDIRSDLSGAGVNQTVHRILIDLRVTLSVILPGGAQAHEVGLTVCLAETLIIGEVPPGLITQK
ncbi:MAG: sporulation protein YunB, partial [Oscillospiraceae bacterium]|nr:sporulation protein YunB [Oscillospiraceae bacterium]